MSEGKQTMAQRLQELRQEKGFSQSELAEAAGVPLGSLKNWEQGVRQLPRLDAAWQLAQALGITLDELAGDVFKDLPKGKAKKPTKGKPKK